MFETVEKGLFGSNFHFGVETIGNIRWFWVANQTENWKRARLSLIYIIIEGNTLVENEGRVTGLAR